MRSFLLTFTSQEWCKEQRWEDDDLIREIKLVAFLKEVVKPRKTGGRRASHGKRAAGEQFSPQLKETPPGARKIRSPSVGRDRGRRRVREMPGSKWMRGQDQLTEGPRCDMINVHPCLTHNPLLIRHI